MTKVKSRANKRIDLDNPLDKFAWVNNYFKDEFKKSGYKMDDKLKYYCRQVFNHVRQDFDTYIVISGHTGYGKSNLACTMGFLIDPEFDLEKNVIYTPTIDELRLKIRYRKAVENNEPIPEGALKPYSVIVVDEAIKVLYKLEQWGAVARYMKKLFDLARTENKVVILCIPDFLDMGNIFRNRMDWWIDVFYRKKFNDDPKRDFAVACVESKSRNKYKSDKWNTGENQKEYEAGVGRRKYSDLGAGDNLKLYKRSKNYVASFNFNPLPPTVQANYIHFKNLHDYDNVEIAKKIDKYKVKFQEYELRVGKLALLLKNKFGYSYNKTSSMIGLSHTQIGLIINKLKKSGKEGVVDE